MNYSLDSNVFIRLLTRRSGKLESRIAQCRPGEAVASSIVAHELYFGAHKGVRVDYNLEVIEFILRDFSVIEFNQEDARVAGEIRAQLQKQGQMIGPYDLLIAGQAKARGLTLVTSNLREFARVEGLKVEDWAQ